MLCTLIITSKLVTMEIGSQTSVTLVGDNIDVSGKIEGTACMYVSTGANHKVNASNLNIKDNATFICISGTPSSQDRDFINRKLKEREDRIRERREKNTSS